MTFFRYIPDREARFISVQFLFHEPLNFWLKKLFGREPEDVIDVSSQDQATVYQKV